MIDLEQQIGTNIIFVGPLTPTYRDAYGLEVGDRGVIDYVDPDDEYMTYRIKFPHRDNGLWISNTRLVVAEAGVEDTELCGWKPRALKAEKELRELKKALKTLSEV